METLIGLLIVISRVITFAIWVIAVAYLIAVVSEDGRKRLVQLFFYGYGNNINIKLVKVQVWVLICLSGLSSAAGKYVTASVCIFIVMCLYWLEEEVKKKIDKTGNGHA